MKKRIIIASIISLLTIMPTDMMAQSGEHHHQGGIFSPFLKKKPTNDNNTTKKTKNTTAKERMTNKERAEIVYNLLRNKMVKMPQGTMYHAGKKTEVREVIINRRPITNREYAAATDIWINRNAPDSPARVNASQRQLFLDCITQALGRTSGVVREASSNEIAYGDRNSYISNAQDSYIFFVYRDNWEKYIKNKQYLTIFGISYK